MAPGEYSAAGMALMESDIRRDARHDRRRPKSIYQTGSIWPKVFCGPIIANCREREKTPGLPRETLASCAYVIHMASEYRRYGGVLNLLSYPNDLGRTLDHGIPSERVGDVRFYCCRDIRPADGGIDVISLT